MNKQPVLSAPKIAPRQRGAALIVTLLMLVVITLLAVALINSSTVNLRIVDNMRTIQEQESMVQRAIERVSSDPSFFAPGGGDRIINFDNNLDPNNEGTNNVRVEPAQCISAFPPDGTGEEGEGSATGGTGVSGEVGTEITIWLVRACFTSDNNCDPEQHMTITQGVRTLLLVGNCV